MRKFLNALIFSGLVSCPAFAAQPVFMSGFEDLPLMDGLKQFDDGAVAFDAPSGRIVEAYAQSEDVGRKSVLDFYGKTLPQLGWKRMKGAASASVSFTREGEELTISVDDGTPATVRFELKTTEKD